MCRFVHQILIAISGTLYSLMDYWSCTSDGGDLLFSEEEMETSVDALGRSKSKATSAGWDMKNPFNFDNDVLSVDKQAIESLNFMELGLYDMMRKPLPCKPSMENSGARIASTDFGSVSSPACIITSNSLLEDEESGSGLSSSVIESKSQGSSLMNSKLGNLVDCGDAQNRYLSNKRSSLSSHTSSLPNKRARTASLYPQTPFCQVHGCGVDLSSAKDYYKRHRVCVLHTKTAKVIVGGMEQRFCQQCSRFHLLAEFDDGKRSCRKRLAGHNQRRRKPQFDTIIDEQKFLQSYQGMRIMGTSFSPRKLFPLSGIIPGGVFYPDSYERINSSKPAKLTGGPVYSPQFAIPFPSKQLRPTSYHFHHLNRVGKQSRNTSSGAEDYTPCNAASTVRKLSEFPSASCALSLLSAHSADFPGHSVGIPRVRSMTLQGSLAHYCMSQNIGNPLGLRFLEKECFTPSESHSSGTMSLEIDQIRPIVLSDADNAVHCGIHPDKISLASNYLKTRHCLSPEHGHTVNLDQLSSNLQMVEHQRSIFNQTDSLLPLV